MSEKRNEVFGGRTARDMVGMSAADALKKELNYEIPVESVPMPSAGSVYPEGNPLHNRETIEIKAMTAREEDILMSRALLKKGVVITELLKSCIVDKNVDASEMLAGDRNAIMIAVRITGYGADYTVETNCPQCDSRETSTFNLGQMPIKRLTIKPVEPGANLFSFKLPVSGQDIQFKFLTGRDDKEISTTQDRLKKQGIYLDNSITSKLQCAIQTISGNSDKNLIANFVRNMPARDSLALRKFIENNEPGVEMKGWLECSACGEQSEVPVPVGASFFWPAG